MSIAPIPSILQFLVFVWVRSGLIWRAYVCVLRVLNRLEPGTSQAASGSGVAREQTVIKRCPHLEDALIEIISIEKDIADCC